MNLNFDKRYENTWLGFQCYVLFPKIYLIDCFHQLCTNVHMFIFSVHI